MIKKLDCFPDTDIKYTPEDRMIVPTPTTDNMEIIVNKINELIEIINEIKQELNTQETYRMEMNERR